MAGRAFNRILLIAAILICSYSIGFAESGQNVADKWELTSTEKCFSEGFQADSVHSELLLRSDDIRFQESFNSRFRDLYEQLDPDFYLGISYNNRSLSGSFLENNSILSNQGFENQFLYSIDITPAVIILDQFSLEFTYSSIPDQRNFPNSTVLDFESERIILNEVNRYSGHALTISSAYSVPIVVGVRAAVHFGISRMKLNVEETMQYHPDDPFAPDYSITTLPFRKKEVIYSNPFAGLSAEFQLRSIRLTTGYQIQLYKLEEVSSSNFYIALGLRLKDLF